MNPLPEGEDKCPHCGYQEGMPYSMTYLRPGTVLKERYLIGKVADKNSEGATYIAYDQTEDKKANDTVKTPTDNKNTEADSSSEQKGK